MLKIKNLIHVKTYNMKCISIFMILILISIFIVIYTSSCYSSDINNNNRDNRNTRSQIIISENTSWTLAESPYIITDNVIVEQEAILTIEPGVEVRFDGAYFIQIEGKLLSEGTENNMITFTSNKNNPSPGDWHYIFLSGSANDNSIIKYCELEYSGDGIKFDNNSPIIVDNLIHCNQEGIKSISSDSSAVIRGNAIFRNNYGISINGGSAFIENNVICNNIIGIDNGENPTVTNNTICWNTIGIYCENNPLNLIHNNIYNNTDYNIKNGHPNHEVIAENNWWGTTNITTIEDKIYDYNDNFQYAKVIYKPFLIEFNLNAPDASIYLNKPPNAPIIFAGITSGTTNTSNIYSTSTTDPENDQIKYGWDWDGDGTIDVWSDLVDSGTEDNRSHCWSAVGTYNVRVKAIDEYGAESGWSNSLVVTITEETLDSGNNGNNDLIYFIIIIIAIIVVIVVGTWTYLRKRA